MYNTKTKIIDLPNIEVDEDALNDITMVNPINFISEEQNEKIFERVKDGLINISNPNRWLTWEESDRILTEKYFSNNV